MGKARKQDVVAVCLKPQTLEEKQFNLDGITFLHLLNGMSYENAQDQAVIDMLELEPKTKKEVKNG